MRKYWITNQYRPSAACGEDTIMGGWAIYSVQLCDGEEWNELIAVVRTEELADSIVAQLREEAQDD